MKKTKLFVLNMLICVLSVISQESTVLCQMARSETIGNDPVKERLCIDRASAKGKVVPFLIDAGYVARFRTSQPDITFIAVDGTSPQLIACYKNSVTGEFGPNSLSPEQDFWHLIKPQELEPQIGTIKADSFAGKACFAAAAKKINRSDLDHNVRLSVLKVGFLEKDQHGPVISGIKAERYDVIVEARSLYPSAGPDMAAITYKCLFSPMLELKAVQIK